MKWLPAHEGRRLARNSNGELDPSRGGALAHGVIAVVGAIERVVCIDVEAVRAAEHTLPPGAQEISLAVEHHHGMLPAVENVNLVLAVDCDRGDVLERPTVRQFRPVFHHPIAMLTTAQNYRHSCPPICPTIRHLLALPDGCRTRLRCILRAMASIDRYEDRVAQLAGHGLRQMALAAGVLDEQHLTCTDDAALAVACGDLHAAIEIDDVLAAGGRMPIEVVIGRSLAEDDAGGGQARRELAEVALLDPGHLNVAEVRLAVGVNVEIVNAHAPSSRLAYHMSVAGYLDGASLWPGQSCRAAMCGPSFGAEIGACGAWPSAERWRVVQTAVHRQVVEPALEF